MVGRQNAIFDGQWQPDGTWLYYTSNLYGRRPAMLNTHDIEGHPVAMEFVSPFARILPLSLPKLEVGYSPDAQKKVFRHARENDMQRYYEAKAREQETMLRSRQIAEGLELMSTDTAKNANAIAQGYSATMPCRPSCISVM